MSQKRQFSKKSDFLLQTLFTSSNLDQISILRIVLETSDCVELKTGQEHENMSKNSGVTACLKYFFREFVGAKSLQKG